MSETSLPSINASSDIRRKNHELPAVLVRNGWRYHHLGIPTSTPRLGEKYLPAFRMYVSGFESNPFGIEWMRFEEGSPLPELVRTVPHVAFVVDDLEKAIEGTEILSAINSPSDDVRVAMIISDDAPVELMEFRARRE